MKKARLFLSALLAGALVVSVLPTPVSAASTLSAPEAPASPASAGATSTALSIAWQPPSSGPSASVYEVYINSSKAAVTKELTATISSLSANTSYDVTVKACNDTGCSPSSDPTSMATRPAAATALKAATKDGGLSVSFTPSPGPLSLTHSIWYKPLRAGTWTEWTPGTPDVSPTTVTGLTNGSAYSVKVESSNSSYSVTSSFVTSTPAAVPSTPSLTHNVAASTTSSITVSWTASQANGSNVAGYDLYRNGVKVSRQTGLSYAFLALSAGTTYSLTISACNAAGCSPQSQALSVATRPAAPASVTATPADAAVTVSYPSSASSNVTGYTLYYKSSLETVWTEWTPGVSDSSPVTVTGLKNSVSYNFKVTALSSVGSTDSRTALATPRKEPEGPVLAVRKPTQTSLELYWLAPVSNGSKVTGYEVFQNGTKIATTTALVHTLSGLTPGTSYSYEVRACNVSGCGAKSSAVVVPTKPVMPTSLSVSPLSGRLVLSWTNSVSPVVTSHNVFYRLATSSAWSEWTPGVSDSSPVVVTGLTGGSGYVLKVTSCNASGCTDSVSATGSPRSIPDTPVLSLDSATHNSIKLAFTPGYNGGAPITSYEVWSGGVKKASTALTGWTFTGLSPLVSQSYTLKACNAAGCSDPSSSLSVITAPLPASALAATGSLNTVTVTFTPSPTASSHKVEYKTDAQTTWTEWTPGDSDSSPTLVTGLKPGVSYSFRVGAQGPSGPAVSYPAAVSAKPQGKPDKPATGVFTRSVSAETALTKAQLRWTAPANNGGSPITSFEITVNGSTVTASSNATSREFSGLEPGRKYPATVRACNTHGCSEESVSLDLYTAPLSIDPSTVEADPTQSAVDLSWDPSDAQELSGYKVRYRKVVSGVPGSWSTPTDTAPKAKSSSGLSAKSSPGVLSTSYTLSGLTPSTSYQLQVAPYNSATDATWPASTTSFTTDALAAPGKPGSVTVAANNKAVLVSWTAPTSTGGSLITGYRVYYASNLSGVWSTNKEITVVGSTTLKYNVSSLLNGTKYRFSVAAVNSQGIGTASDPVEATPRTIPEAPDVAPGVGGDGQVTLSWTPPANNGGAPIIEYQVDYLQAGKETTRKTLTPNPSGTSVVISGLTNGQPYSFQVKARNEAGFGAYDTAAGTPTSAPGAPSGLTAVPGDSSVTFSWSPPTFTGGVAVSGYEVKVGDTPDMTLQTIQLGNVTSTVITGLDNGTPYYLSVAAKNTAGTGDPALLPDTVTPRTKPGAPTDVLGVPGDSKITLSWSPPESNGGAEVTGYIIQHSSNNGITWSPATGQVQSPHTITGLTNGTEYKVRVFARNVAGDSDPGTIAGPYKPITNPGKPGVVSATPGNTQATLAWAAPLTNGGSDVTDYIVELTSDNGLTVSVFADGTRSATGATVTGLTNGTPYKFRVKAVNAASVTGGIPTDWSPAVTPRTTPDKPTPPTGTPGNSEVSLSWTAPANGGAPIEHYEVQYSANGGTSYVSYGKTANATASIVVKGLQNGYGYVFQVRAVNVAGNSDWSDASSEVKPRTVPVAPNPPTGTPGNAEVALVWEAPADGGSPVLDYTVKYSSNSGTTWNTFVDGVSTDVTATVTDLTNGTAYVFQIIAKNAAGDSTPSLKSSPVTPFTTPGAPGKPTGVAKDASVTLSWAPPTNNGSVVTEYVVEYNAVGTADWLDGGTFYAATGTVTGLTNGTQYKFRVKAMNAAGYGAWSLDSDQVKPFGKPGKPTLISVLPGNRTLDLKWSAPTDDGGSAVTDYVIRFSTDDGVSWSTYTDPTSTLTQHSLINLTNGTSYRLCVAAKNAGGLGECSDPSDPVKPRTTTLKPGKPTTTPENTQVSLSWAAPTDDGGAAITEYSVQYAVSPVLQESDWVTATDDDGSTSDLSAVVSGLTNGTGYVFRVRALNAAGWSEYSLPSAITTPRTTPGTPGKPSGVFGSKQINFSWTAPADDGGDAIFDYVIEFKPASAPDSDWTSFADVESSATAALVTGLTDGTAYVVRVKAENQAGLSDSWSDASDPVTPYSPTSQPTWLPGSISDGSVSLAWQEPADLGGGSVSGYDLQYSSTAAGCDSPGWTLALDNSLVLSHTVTGLTNGTDYRFCVRATNQAGDSQWSSLSPIFRPLTTPGPVVTPNAQEMPSAVKITWKAPLSDGGSLITKYEVEHAVSGEAWSGNIVETQPSVLERIISSLENGTEYKFRVRAVTVVGNGPWSSPDLVSTPFTNPDAPTDLILFARALEIEASWTAPLEDGGKPVTKYVVKWKPANATSWFSVETNDTSYTIPNLTRNTSYVVEVYASNGLTSPPVSETVTTAAAYDAHAPTITSIERGYKSLKVSFIEPASDGGADITQYQYSLNNSIYWKEVPLTSLDYSNASEPSFVISTLSLNTNALANNTIYQVKIRANNAANLKGIESIAVSQRTAGRPGTEFPVLSQHAPDDLSMHFTFPAIDPQGTPVTQYEYSTDDGATWNVATVSESGGSVSSTVTLKSDTDTDLTNGVWYKVKWRAKNLVGWSDPSITYTIRPRTIPGVPTLISATGDNRAVILEVAQNTDNGGAPVEKYQYQYKNVTLDGDYGDWIDATETPIELPGKNTLLVSGLDVNTTYEFMVRTWNEAGPSTESAPAQALTQDYPGSPVIDGYQPAANQITALFSIPEYDGRTAVIRYQYSLDGGSYTDFTPQDLVITPSGSESGKLVFSSPSGQWRVLKIRTENAVGFSQPSAPMSVIAAYPPSAPRNLLASRNLASLSLSWQEPADLGFAPVLDYLYSLDGGASWSSLGTASNSDVIESLAHCTTYSVIIKAVNVAGQGTASTPSSSQTFCKPSTPTQPTASASERRVTISWTAPANGGTSITGYAIQRSTNGGSSWSQVVADTKSTATSYTDSVSNNTAYVYRVAAINAVDTGSYSPASPSVTPVVPPPTGVTQGSVSASAASFSWNASGSSYLASTDRYRVYRGSTYLGATDGTSFTSSGLSENTAYTFYIYAVDDLGTWSSAASVSITTSNTPIWAQGAGASNDASYVGSWVDEASKGTVRRSISWWLDPADGQNYHHTDVYVRSGSYNWGQWAYVGAAWGSESGVSGSFTDAPGVPVTPGVGYTVLLRVVDAYSGSSDYTYDVTTPNFQTRDVYTEVSGTLGNSAGEYASYTRCEAQSTQSPGSSSWANCAESHNTDGDQNKGWLSADLGNSNSGTNNWWMIDTGDQRWWLGKNAYESGYPQSPGATNPSYEITGVRLLMPMCHRVKVEIDYSGGNDSYYADTATGAVEYCAGWHTINLADRGVRVDSASNAFWSAKLTVYNPRTYCCSNYKNRVRISEVHFYVHYWKQDPSNPKYQYR